MNSTKSHAEIEELKMTSGWFLNNVRDRTEFQWTLLEKAMNAIIQLQEEVKDLRSKIK